MPHPVKIVSPQVWVNALADMKNFLQTSLPMNGGCFRVVPGWVVNSVLPDEHLLYYVGDGGFTATAAGQTYDMHAGSLIWLMPGTPFIYRLPQGQSLTLYRFRLKVMSHRSSVRIMPDCFVAHGYAQGRAWYEKLMQDALMPDSRDSVYRRALLVGLFTELFVHAQAPAQSQQLGSGQQRALEQYAQLHIREPISPADLARAMNLSPDYFTRLFRRTYGMPPRKWIVHQRIRHAAQRLVQSSLSVSDVAGELGYSDLFFFSRQFKEVMGMSPLRYRRSSY